MKMRTLTKFVFGNDLCLSTWFTRSSFVLSNNPELVLAILLQVLHSECEISYSVSGNWTELGAVLVFGFENVFSDWATTIRIGSSP